ncbi:MAG TPA: hypothetical protein VLG13_00715 [Patescibacteria group bacterium]|nr:hypothetical protein [Patescibacteria group bacterium]
MKQKKYSIYVRLAMVNLLAILVVLGATAGVEAANQCPTGETGTPPNCQATSSSTSQTTPPTSSFNLDSVNTSHQCGSKDGAVKTSINFGCKGESCLTTHPDAAYCSGNNSGILDVTFAIIRFLSYGVGLVIIGSLVVAGIQYTSSQGDPKASAQAQERIKSTVIALLVFIFAYAILDYIVPAGFLK